MSNKVLLADFVISAWELAVIVTFTALAMNEGAVYSPLAPIVPHAEVHPDTLHTTAVSEVLATTALN